MKVVVSATRIRGMRQELEYTQEQFAALIGRSWSTVARWESRGGIKGRVPATGKKAESVRMLQNLEEILKKMITEKMSFGRRSLFLVTPHKALCELSPIAVARIAGRDSVGKKAISAVHYLIWANAKS